MSDVDEMISSLAIILAEEISDAEFGDDVMDVGSSGDDAGAGFQRRHDLAGAFVGSGLDGDDGLASAIGAQSGPANEIDLTSDACGFGVGEM